MKQPELQFKSKREQILSSILKQNSTGLSKAPGWVSLKPHEYNEYLNTFSNLGEVS
jgi:hypothetical protein